MEDKLKKINGFIPALTAFVVLIAFLFYMVAYFFIKGLDTGYGITSIVGSQEELVASGFLILTGLIDEIAIEAFWLLIGSWYFFFLGLLIAVFIIFFDKLFVKESSTSVFPSTQQYARYIIWLLIVLYIFITCPFTAFEKGKSYAHNRIKEINEKGCEIESDIWEACSTISYDTLLKTVKLEGYLLDKKGREVTIYLPKEKMLRTLVLPKDAVIERRSISE